MNMIEVVKSVVSEDGLVYGILIPRPMSGTLWVYIGSTGIAKGL